MKHILMSIVCITLVLTLLGLAGMPDEAAAQKDTLVVGIPYAPHSLDPSLVYDFPGWIIMANVYERLVTYPEDDPSRPPIPQLAASWDLAEDSRTWTFHLRKGATFASGNPVTADAVVFSLRRFVKLAGPPSWLLTQLGITEHSITKIDTETVQIVLEDQYAPIIFLSCLAFSHILDPKVVLAHEQDGDLGSAWLEDHAAGSGPYTIEERQRGKRIVLKANDRYWGPKPVFERVIVKIINEPAERAALLQAGDLDIARYLSAEDIEVLGNDPEVQIFESLDFFITYLAMSLRYEPFVSPEVRDAVRYAIDYDGIIDYVLGGAAVKHQNIQPKGFLGYTPATPYTWDMEKAKHLLTEGGYPEGFEVELKCPDWSPYLELAMKLKDDLAGIGVTLHLIPMDLEKLTDDTYSRDFQMYLSGWWYDYPDPDANAKAFAFCDSIDDDATVQGPAWYTFYVNPETTTLVKQAAQEMDMEKRRVLYEQINAMIIDDGPFVFLYTPLRYYGVRTEMLPFFGASEYSIDLFPILK
jgi:peptide/nickel transport system substrate-binding protein